MIFVTGGTGLLGSYILLKLSNLDIQFVALKRKSSCLSVTEKIFKKYDAKDAFKNIKWVEGDITEIPSIEEAIQDCEYIIHAAAIVSFHKEDVEKIQKINIEGTENIVNVAIAKKIKKICYISSVAAIGKSLTSEIVDETCYFKVNKNESNYAISKYYAEQEVWRASQEGVDVVILNPSIILGPGDWNKGSSKIFDRVYRGLNFYTTGKSGYVDVIDVANCAINLLQSNIINERFIINSENLRYQDVLNIMSEKFNRPYPRIKVNKFIKEVAWIIESIKSLLTNQAPLITKEPLQMSMSNNEYSSRKIQKHLAYKFKPIQESIEEYCEWYISELRVN